MSILSGGCVVALHRCAKCFSPGVVVDPYDGVPVKCSNKHCADYRQWFELADWQERFTRIYRSGRRVLQ